MIWKNASVLVTGADHFIAINLMERLVKSGSKVHAFIRNDYQGSIGLIERLPLHIRNNIHVVFGNLTNPDIIDHISKGVEIIFHFGILDAIPLIDLNTRGYLEGMIIGTYNVINSARKNNVKKFIHISTAEVYGDQNSTPINESCQLKALTPHIGFDIGAEKIVEGFLNLYNFPATILRLFNVYGPMQSKRAIIPTIILQALKEPKILLGDMHAKRDFVYVDDVVKGIIKSAEINESSGKSINLGSGVTISIGDLADKIANLIGRDTEILFDANRIRIRNHEVEQMVSDTTIANKLLGWSPQTSLDDGLEKTIEWFAEHIGNS